MGWLGFGIVRRSSFGKWKFKDFESFVPLNNHLRRVDRLSCVNQAPHKIRGLEMTESFRFRRY